MIHRLSPARLSVLPRVSGEGGDHQQPRRLSHLLLSVSRVPLVPLVPGPRGPAVRRGRARALPLPLPSVSAARGREAAQCAGARRAAVAGSGRALRQAPVPGPRVLGGPAGPVRRQTQQAGERADLQADGHAAVPLRLEISPPREQKVLLYSLAVHFEGHMTLLSLA